MGAVGGALLPFRLSLSLTAVTLRRRPLPAATAVNSSSLLVLHSALDSQSSALKSLWTVPGHGR